MYSGTHEFWWPNGNHIIIVNTQHSPFGSLRREGVTQLTVHPFVNAQPLIPQRWGERMVRIVAASTRGHSCDAVCAGQAMECAGFLLPRLNSCDSLRERFACEAGCEASFGAEQPAYVDDPSTGNYRKCLFVGSPVAVTTCEASHPATRRLCACIDPFSGELEQRSLVKR